MNEAHRSRINQDDADEQHRQDVKWGADRHHPNGTGPDYVLLGIPLREFRDRAIADTDANFAAGNGTWAQILLEEVLEGFAEEEPRALRHELVQARAVIAQWIADIDRTLGVAPRGRYDQVSVTHIRLLYLLAGVDDATDTQLLYRWEATAMRLSWPLISASGLRTRRAELRRWGLVEPSERLGSTQAGRPSRAWRVKPIGSLELAAARDVCAPISPEVWSELAALEVLAGTDVVTGSHIASFRHYLEAAAR